MAAELKQEMNDDDLAAVEALAAELGWTAEQTASEMVSIALLRNTVVEGK